MPSYLGGSKQLAVGNEERLRAAASLAKLLRHRGTFAIGRDASGCWAIASQFHRVLLVSSKMGCKRKLRVWGSIHGCVQDAI